MSRTSSLIVSSKRRMIVCLWATLPLAEAFSVHRWPSTSVGPWTPTTATSSSLLFMSAPDASSSSSSPSLSSSSATAVAAAASLPQIKMDAARRKSPRQAFSRMKSSLVEDPELLMTMSMVDIAMPRSRQRADAGVFGGGDLLELDVSSVQDAQQQQQVSMTLPLWQLALAGSLTTFVSDMAMHPLDCIKTLQQSDIGMTMSAWQAACHLYDTAGGISGLYHGFLTYACSDAVGGALKFATWESWKQSVMRRTQGSLFEFPSLFMGAALAFVIASVILVPGELLKQQLQMSYFDDLWQGIHWIYTNWGLGGFYAGYEGALYRDVPYTMLELGLYECIKNFMEETKKERESMNNSGADTASTMPSTMDEVVAAAVTGAIVAFCTTPADVVKTKLMVDAQFFGASFMDCAAATVHDHGWMALFAGAVTRTAWIVPLTAFYLPAYDFLKRALWERHITLQQQIRN